MKLTPTFPAASGLIGLQLSVRYGARSFLLRGKRKIAPERGL